MTKPDKKHQVVKKVELNRNVKRHIFTPLTFLHTETSEYFSPCQHLIFANVQLEHREKFLCPARI